MGLKEKQIEIKLNNNNNKNYKEKIEKEGLTLLKLIEIGKDKKAINIDTYKEAYFNTTAMERKVQTEWISF